MVLAEAELIRVAYEIMTEFDFLPAYYFRINHMGLNEVRLMPTSIYKKLTCIRAFLRLMILTMRQRSLLLIASSPSTARSLGRSSLLAFAMKSGSVTPVLKT